MASLGRIADAQTCIKLAMNIFDEQYRVVAVESHSLTIRGERSGDVLVIKADSDNPISQEEFPLGKLIRLSDPLRPAAN